MDKQTHSRKASEDDIRGSSKLDIITNGLATKFSAIATSDFILINAVADWAQNLKTWSYQEIVSESDSFNLYGVNGDEDNATSPWDPRVHRFEYNKPPQE